MIEDDKELIGRIINPCKSAFFFVGLFSLFSNLLILTVPLYMLQIFDRVLSSQSYETLFYLTVIAIFAILTFGLLDLARTRVLLNVGNWLDKRLNMQALLHSTDDILTGHHYAPQALQDVQKIRGFICSPMVFFLLDSPWVPIFIIIIFLLHPMLGIITLVGAFILLLLAVLNEVTTRKLILDAGQINMEVQNKIQNTLRNSETIQAMGMMPLIIDDWFEHNEKALDYSSRASKRIGLILSASKFFRMTLQILVLGVGAFYVIGNEMTPGAMIAASILLGRAYAPLEQSISSWKNFVSIRNTWSRLKHYLSQPIRQTSIKLPKPKGMIVAENVSFSPTDPNHSILKNISFIAKPGEILAVVGPSASGKTTLSRLIVGIWKPTQGNVRLDGADVYSWERSDFGKHVGYLPQGVELFSGTVRQNISRMQQGDPDAVIQASQAAHAHDMILKLPHGYETKLDERSYQLSAGQKQRIALARALYKRPRVLVLDEPNSNLDADGQSALMSALKAAKLQGQTVIIISHQSDIISLADRIMLLHQGGIRILAPRQQALEELHRLFQLQRGLNKNAKNPG